MTIDEAIKILTHDDDTFQTYTVTIRNRAVKLGIEALKRISDMRTSPCTTADEILLGETE